MKRTIKWFIISILLVFILGACEGFDLGDFDFGNIKDRLEEINKGEYEIPIDLSTPPEGFTKTFEEGTIGNYMIFFKGEGTIADAEAAFEAWLTQLGAALSSESLGVLSYAPHHKAYTVNGFNGHIAFYTQGEAGDITVVIVILNYDAIDNIELPDVDAYGYDSDLLPRFEGSIRVEFYTAYESESSTRYSVNNLYIVQSSIDDILAFYRQYLTSASWVITDETAFGFTATKGVYQLIITLGTSEVYEGLIELRVTAWYPDFWDPTAE